MELWGKSVAVISYGGEVAQFPSDSRRLVASFSGQDCR
jgi:hypothetical protein